MGGVARQQNAADAIVIDDALMNPIRPALDDGVWFVARYDALQLLLQALRLQRMFVGFTVVRIQADAPQVR